MQKPMAEIIEPTPRGQKNRPNLLLLEPKEKKRRDNSLPWVGCLGLPWSGIPILDICVSGVTVQSRHHKDSLRDEFSKQALQVWKLQYPYGVHSLVNFRQSNSLKSTRQLLTIFVHWSRQVTASVYNMHPQTLVTRLHPQCSACRPASSAATFFIQALASDDLTSKLIPLPIGIMLHGWPVIDFRPNCGFEFCLWQCWKWKFHSAQFDRISGFWSGPKETDTWTFRFKAHTFLVISALKFLNPLINHHFPHGKGNFKVSIFGDTLTVDFCVWT